MIDRGWKKFEALDIESLDCPEENVGRNMDVKDDPGERSDGREESRRESFYCLRKCLCCCEECCRKYECYGASGEISEMRDIPLDTTGKMILAIK